VVFLFAVGDSKNSIRQSGGPLSVPGSTGTAP